MRTTLALALLAALCVPSSSAAKPKPKKPPAPPAPVASPHVEVVHVKDGWRADLAFDGSLLGWAVPRGAGRTRSLFVLVGDKRERPAAAAVPCGVHDDAAAQAHRARLYRWRAASPDRLELLASELPEGSLDAADLDGDGEDELTLERDGRIELVTTSREGKAQVRALVEDPAFGRFCCGPRVSWEGPVDLDAALRVALVGAFRTYRSSPDGSIALTSEVAIPTRMRAGADRVRVESPAVRAIGRAASGRMLFATEPEPLGHRRLHTVLIDPDGPEDARSVESWAMFPGPERVVDTALSLLDGAPVLIVTTTSAERLSLLGEKALRIYALSGDRTRAGNDPVFATTTGINLWQTAFPAVVDLDRDGHEDLLLAYWKGLKSSIAALEVYRGAVPSGFGKAHSVSFDVENGDKGFMAFGDDLDGDGRPDLVLLANKELLVFPGTPQDKAASKPVATNPSRRIALPADLPGARGTSMGFGTDGLSFPRSPGGLGTPTLLDLDGDGRPEAVFAGDGAGGGRLTVVFVQASSSLAPSGTLPASERGR